MIQNRQNEESPYVDRYLLNARDYGDALQNLAEYNYDKHRIEGWLTYWGGDTDDYGVAFAEEEPEKEIIGVGVQSVTWRKYGHRIIYSGTETRMEQFIRELYDDLDKRGFTNSALCYKRVKEQTVTKERTSFGCRTTSNYVSAPTGGSLEGYIVFVHVEW